ncbi:MAG: helix-turn-helix domain-containing protein [Firmicutes bacterium]|nr:helix-turn-helix domain-containing protein [Bacillota bacterium]
MFDEIKLVVAMAKKGLNLTKLSQESGVSRQTLSMMKAGKVVDGTGQEYKRIRLYVW